MSEDLCCWNCNQPVIIGEPFQGAWLTFEELKRSLHGEDVPSQMYVTWLCVHCQTGGQIALISDEQIVASADVASDAE